MSTLEPGTSLDPGMASGAGTAVVIDDEAGLRRIVVRHLAGAGYRIEEYASGEAGLRAVEALGADAGLVVTDLVMPGISGVAVATVLRRYRPWLPVICMTGAWEPAPGEALPPGIALLQKPFAKADLLALVRETCARAAQARRAAHEVRDRTATLRTAMDLVAAARSLRP